MTGQKSTNVQEHSKLSLNGEWVQPSGSDTLDVINSTTEEVMGRIPEGTPEDIDRAVAAARAAFESWSATSAVERAAFLQKISAALVARRNGIAEVIASELGMPPPLAT